MDDTQIAQSAKGGQKGGQKKAKCQEVILHCICNHFASLRANMRPLRLLCIVNL